MAEEPTEDDSVEEDATEEDIAVDSDDVDDDGESEEKKGGKGKLIAIIVVAFLIILGGAGGGLYFMGFLDSVLGLNDPYAEEVSDEPPDLGTPIYHELPEFVADLASGQCRAGFLKLSLTIQVDELDLPIVLEREPKIIDRFQQHLRSKQKLELSGRDGAETLRTELTLILDATLNPVKIQNVLFRSMVVQ